MSRTAVNSESGEAVPEAVQNSPILQTQVWSRMHNRDNNWMGAVVGETGLGKSYTCLSIAEAVDPDFSIEQVAFGLTEFMELVMDDSYGRGSMIVLEEASVEAAAEDFHEMSNKVLRTVLETWRNQNRGALLNLPTFSRLDVGARIRMTALIQQQEKNEEEGYSVAKYKHLQTNSDTGKIYRHYPTIEGKQHKYLKIAPPTEELRQAYEKKSREYTAELNEDLLEQLLESQRDAQEQTTDPREIADDILESGLEDYVAENNGQRYISRDLIQVDYDVGQGRSKEVKAALKRDAPDELLEQHLNSDSS